MCVCVEGGGGWGGGGWGGETGEEVLLLTMAFILIYLYPFVILTFPVNRGSYMSAHVFIEFIKRVGEKR